ncbi:spore coat protein CotJB [Anaerosporomusa subterranea]|uniref:Spore coat protein CotJB n=1 Tax=Anaerosporomusa subterranea TaxID=1794912 RepID=A0A154BPB8_ANASB|nr:spore coat protein CotJB [Anaerosporomusa subterranea]KYZ75837.1 spore coat protein CotJB [Anaerosporomusa subterranea]
MKCDDRQMAMLMKIQEMQFVSIELQLYLDTHPCDQDALNDYRCAVEALHKYIMEYETEFGSLIALSPHYTGDNWDWAEGPWPWEM